MKSLWNLTMLSPRCAAYFPFGILIQYVAVALIL
jgi:hypothetical protein